MSGGANSTRYARSDTENPAWSPRRRPLCPDSPAASSAVLEKIAAFQTRPSATKPVAKAGDGVHRALFLGTDARKVGPTPLTVRNWQKTYPPSMADRIIEAISRDIANRRRRG